jgi:23S rRNA pseudouridine1911/1915/1917 synthase
MGSVHHELRSDGRVLHVLSPAAGLLSACVREWLDPARTHELLALGAVYHNRTRALEDVEIAAGDYLRLHLSPKRYAIEPARLDAAIVAETDDYLILDKPSGLPMHPSLDNARENLIAAMEQRLARRLYVTQRLDVGTSGLVLVAKTPAFQARYNRWLAERRVEKWYRARVEGTVAPGRYVHWQEPSERAPKRVQAAAAAGYLECALTVLRAENDTVWIRLETGRTHQIRAQLGLLGAPILGDVLYGSRVDGGNTFALEACALFLPVRGAAWQLRRQFEFPRTPPAPRA